MADSTPHEYLGKAFGIQRAMDSIGGMLGAVIALYFFPMFGYRNMFLLAFIPGFLAMFSIMFVQEYRKAKVISRDKIPDHNNDFKRPEISLRQGIHVLPRKLLIFIIISAIFAIGNFSYAFLLLKIKHIGGTDVDALLYFVVFTAIDTLVAIPAGVLSDKWGRKTILLGSYIIFTAVAAALIFTNSMTGILLCFIGLGIVASIIDGAQRAYVSEIAPKEYRATALGLFYTAIGIVALPGGYLLGTIRDKFSPSSMFACSTGIGILTILRVIMLKNRKHPLPAT